MRDGSTLTLTKGQKNTERRARKKKNKKLLEEEKIEIEGRIGDGTFTT